MELRMANGCGPTGRLLQRLIGASPKEAVVCWGRGYAGPLPALNARAGQRNKLSQLEALRAKGVLVPLFWTQAPGLTEMPLLSRRLHHVGGRDIRLILQPSDLPTLAGDFYTKYIPRAAEYRVWVYRRRHLGTYEKCLIRPAQYRGVGANYANGFGFTLLNSESVPETLRTLGAKAVDALDLDFGAVDILKGYDGRFFVLEVNTAPGVEGENRQVIQGLATKIRRWLELGMPKRNGAA